ncbi:hypothetical protein [Bradyrhizobium sp. Ash2021]|uniref:hypothetical protein n=1 Tax=Bradyrhizobium sp. Ash2021 TaxID=2954771 RepID=UPI0028161D4B|nr:hypothetical protein [Bradyrhizobium sp. Ash2021]WMT75213.1 hypothetical protein NL528_01900 [Bradyrhizobium sp. Ash2021]
MASMFNPTSHSGTIHGPTDSSRDADDRLTCPLAFSAVGLLASCLALAIQDEASLDALRVALILGAAPVAALVALRIYR